MQAHGVPAIWARHAGLEPVVSIESGPSRIRSQWYSCLKPESGLGRCSHPPPKCKSADGQPPVAGGRSRRGSRKQYIPTAPLSRRADRSNNRCTNRRALPLRIACFTPKAPAPAATWACVSLPRLHQINLPSLMALLPYLRLTRNGSRPSWDMERRTPGRRIVSSQISTGSQKVGLSVYAPCQGHRENNKKQLRF